MPKTLVGLAANLPPAPSTDLQGHLAKLKAAGPQPAPPAPLSNVYNGRRGIISKVVEDNDV
jgi:hypothetical protein